MADRSRWTENGVDLGNPKSFGFWVPVTLRFSDQDSVGHINNVSYTALVESGRIAWMNDFGRRMEGAARFGFAALHINFIEEMFYPGMVDVGTCVIAISNRSFMLGHGLFKDGHAHSTATCVLAHTAARGRGGGPIPDSVREALAEELRLAQEAVRGPD